MRRLYRAVTLLMVTVWLTACHSDGVTGPPPLSSSTLVFNQNDATGYSVLYSISSDGSNRRQLTPTGSMAVTFAIAPDARHIAVTVAGATNPISILDRNGNVTQRVPSPSSDIVSLFGGVFDVESWSPDGKLLVGGYNPDQGEMTTSGGFYSVAADNMSYRGEFSPDGSRIAFGRSAAHGTEVAVMNADGSNIQMLTSGNGGAGFPAWSPDGRRIAFTRLTSFSVGTPVPIVIVLMYVMNADGSGLVQISPDSVFDTSPTWSPDGQALAVLRSKDSGNNFDIYVMNADGTGAHAITSDGGVKHWLRWSPKD
jgi:TolB protein